MNFYKILHLATHYLVIAGALNWGLVGAFNIDIVAQIFGKNSFPARILYILIGLSALYMLFW
jgi:uncharacterized membrane protein YuzA (DUF378 family)